LGERYLAFDLGAESGRAILGDLEEDGRLGIAEIHRFPNSPINVQGHLHWDAPALYEEMLRAMSLCARDHTASPTSIGVDTWGVDFALLDRQGKLTGLPFSYRDPRTRGAMESFWTLLSRERLYELTGIQFLPMNSLYQLHAMVRDRSPQLEAAADLLFMPDLFNYWLSGVKKTEFTFATTSQLYNPRAGDWEPEIFDRLGASRGLMQEVVPPGTVLGEIAESVSGRTGLGRVPLVAVASHDTGSAVAALPARGSDFAYISSGTWSLAGIESRTPILTAGALQANATNEGGVCGTFRVLKNITGLWLLQECRKSWAKTRVYSYDELARLAEGAGAFVSLLDPDHPEFLNPPDMPRAIQGFCQGTGQPVPGETGAFVRAILESLALAYRHALAQLKELSGQAMGRVHVIGGGSRNRLLCQFTADATGLPVVAGPVEATAIGNLLIQAMALGRIKDLEEMRKIVRDSFALALYEPHPSPDWDAAYDRFLQLKQAQELH